MKMPTRLIKGAAVILLALIFTVTAYAPTLYALPWCPEADDNGGYWPGPKTDDVRGGNNSYASFYYRKARVGGVSLDQAATFLTDMKDIKGAYFDESTNRVVFIGLKNTSSPVFNKDDLAVAVRAVIFNNTAPQVSIGNGSQSPMPVYYYGGIENTNMGHVLESADYQLKKYLFGYDSSGAPVSSSVPGYSSMGARMVAKGGFSNPGSPLLYRFWISPDQMTLKKDDSGGAFVFDQATMRLQTEVISGGDQNWSQAAQEFVQQFTTNYDAYAQENDIYRRTKELAKLTSVIKWLKDNNIATDYEWAKSYTPAYVPTPTTEPWINTPWYTVNGQQFMLSGGVSFDIPNNYTADSGQALSLKSASQASAPSAEANHWEFTQNSQEHVAVAVAADAFRSIGGYSATVTDMSLPAIGDHDLQFTRSYSSFTAAQNGIGRGWSWMPARLTSTQPWNNVICSPQGGYSGSYPVRMAFESQDGGYETFTYNCGQGYVADKPEYHTRLIRNSDGSYSAYAKDGSYFKFGIGLALLMHRDRNNNGIYYEYDNTVNVTRLHDGHGHQITINRNGSNMITSVSDWANRTVGYGYDANGNLTTVTDPKGGATMYTYDSSNRLVSATDRQNRTLFTHTYNDESKVASTVTASGTTTAYTYDTDDRTVATTDSNQRATTTYYDERARVTKATDALGNALEYTYGDEPMPLTIKDKRQQITSYAYDANGNTTSVTYPNNKQVSYQYDNQNRVTQISDGRYGIVPKITSYTYDSSGNPLTTDEAGTITTRTFDNSGQIESMQDARGSTVRFSYDSFGNLAEEESSTGALTTYVYDTVGRLAQKTDPLGKTVAYAYDANNNVLTYADSVGTTTNTYDPDNRLTSITLPDGQVTSMAYNTSGSQTSTTDPDSNLTSYGYDQYQNLTARQDALSHSTQFAYDKLNRQTEKTTPLGKTAKWEYDANGNMTKRIDESNRQTTYSYDAMNRLAQITYPDASTVTFSYDDRGNLTGMANASGTATFTYDTFDRLTSETDTNNETVGYQYDSVGNMTRITYPGNKQVNYTFDAASRLKSVKDWNNDVTSYVYNPNGTLATKELPNGIAARYTYDSANRLINLQYVKNRQLVKEYSYQRDGMGNVTQEVEGTPQAQQSYVVYDEALRSGWSKSWSWDSTIGMADTGSPYAGTKSIGWRVDAAWAGLHMRSTTGMVDVGSYDVLSFAMKATSGSNHAIGVSLKDQNDNDIGPAVDIGIYGGYPNANGYKVYNIPLSAFSTTATQISGLQFEDLTGAAQPKVYVDDVRFTTGTASDVTLYSEALSPSVMDWSWDTTATFSETVAYKGTKALGATFTAGWGGLLLQTEGGFHTSAYDTVSLALRGSQAGQGFGLQLTNEEGDGVGQALDIAPYNGRPAANEYMVYTIPLADFQLANDRVFGLAVKEDTGSAQPKIYLDDIRFNAKVNGPRTDSVSTFGYDLLGRVISATYPSGSYSYTYDDVGNRMTSNENGAAKTYSYNNDNQLTSQGTRSFTYDNQGNQITDGQKTLSFDYDNQLTSFVDPTTSTTVGFSYDALGNRTRKTLNGSAVYQYVNDNSGGLSRVLVAKSLPGNTQTLYVYGAGLVSQGGDTASTRQYHLDDGLGNVRYVTDSSGNALQAYSYDPYGNQITGGTLSNYSFMEQQNDYETGLTYLRARYYDSTTGRFVSKDPVAGTLTNPQSQNGYSYAHNDPINLSDPSGEFLESLWDGANIVYDVYSCSWGDLGTDLGALAIPILPGGLSKGKRLLNKGENLVPKPNWQKVDRGQIDLLERNGYDIHDLKGRVGADSKMDIFEDKNTGELYVKLKGGTGPGEPLHINIRDLRR